MSDNRIARRRSVEASRAALRTAALAFLREPPCPAYQITLPAGWGKQEEPS